MLVQVHQHVLLETGLAVVDGNAVVVAVEAVDEGLNGRLVQMTQVGCCLAGLLAHDDGLWLDKTEGINDDLALDGLDGVDDHGNGAGSKLFKGLLSVDINGRKPAAETRMRVVPANNGLWSIARCVRMSWVAREILFELTVQSASACPSSSFEKQGPRLRH